MRTLAATVLASAVLAAGQAAAAAAQAPTNTVSADARCMLAMAALGSANKANQQGAFAGIYYFAGRIRAQSPRYDLAAGLKAQMAQMTPALMQAEAQRCGPIVVGVVKSMQAVQQTLAPPGAPAPAPAASGAPSPN